MLRTRRHLHLATWLGIFAMLVLAWVPTVSRVLAASPSADRMAWAEVCGADGMQSMVAAPDNGAPAPGGTHSMLDACVYCSVSSEGVWVQPVLQGAAWTLHVPPRRVAPVVNEPVPAEAPQWPDARPRAPPVLA